MFLPREPQGLRGLVGDCSHEIKRRLLLGRKVMTNLHSIFKSRDITFDLAAAADTQNSASSKVKLESPGNDESFTPTKCWLCTRNSLGCDIMVNRNHVAPVCVKLGRAGSCGTLFSRTSASVKTVCLRCFICSSSKTRQGGLFYY